MHKYLITILFISLLISNNIFLKFISNNDDFIKSNPKIISFLYIDDIAQDQNFRSGKLVIDKNIYKIDLDDQILMVSDNVLKRYNYKTNQIFIEYSFPVVDSIFFNFFNDKFLKMIDNNKSDYSLNFSFNLDSTSITEINGKYQNYNFTIFNIEFIYQNIDSSAVFSFDYPDAFIFDLRD